MADPRQLVIFERECFRCWRFGYPMHRLIVVDIDIAHEVTETGHVYICNDCLLAWKNRPRSSDPNPTTQPFVVTLTSDDNPEA